MKVSRAILFRMAAISPERRNVAVLGASPKPDRYANRAMRLLAEKGYRPIPVNPAFDEIEGEVCFPNLSAIQEPVHTITLYVGPARSTPLIEEIVATKPQRIIMNPGAENDALAEAASGAGIEVVEGCTLVMLQAGLF
jgi:predicted CoA-binding protein